MEGKRTVNSNKYTNNSTSNNIGDIFELLKDIKHSSTNKELFCFFRFTRFYGLLDEKNKLYFEKIEHRQNNLDSINFYCYLSLVSFLVFFYKIKYHKINSIAMCGLLPLNYFDYSEKININYMLLEMKDDYIFKVDRFFRENKNPTILNPKFLIEELSDPNLIVYQKYLKLLSI
jgi:hypothetical protein